jgi:hypothetical protein
MKVSVSFISGVFFAAVAVLQLLRLIYAWPAQIGTFVVPMWLSVVAVLVAAALSVANFVSCHRCR